jgi:hypothetical protein
MYYCRRRTRPHVVGVLGADYRQYSSRDIAEEAFDAALQANAVEILRV